jgi:hypothetical protein
MVKIYGVSDDLVEIEGSSYKVNEIGCFNSDVRIRFVDGTVIRIGYPKADTAIWWIEVEKRGTEVEKRGTEVEKRGTAVQGLTICNNEDARIYSDIFKIDAEIKSHSVIKQKYPQE